MNRLNTVDRNPLVVSRIIGDVLDHFIPIVDLRVCIHGKFPCNGSSLRPSQLASRPRVDIGGNTFRDFYTLVMVDADYPSPSNPHMKEYLHWMVTDIPGTTGASFGKEQVIYEKPELAAGIHRLVLVLFRQPAGWDTVTFFGKRKNFNTRDFADVYGLGAPVAAMFYNGEGKNGCGGRRF